MFFFKTGLIGYRLPTMNHSPIIKILTPQSSIKINDIKKLLFQAPTFKNNLFNTKDISSHFLFTIYGPQEK